MFLSMGPNYLKCIDNFSAEGQNPHKYHNLSSIFDPSNIKKNNFQMKEREGGGYISKFVTPKC